MDPKTTKIDPETDQNWKSKIKIDLVRKSPNKTLQDAPRTPQDTPTWCPRRPKSRPRGAQDASRTAQELPKRHSGSGSQGARSQMTPKSGPRAAQKLPRPPPDLDFGPFWQRFAQDFGPCLGSQIQEHWIHSLSTIRLQCWGGCAPPDPPLLRGMRFGSMFS